MGATRRSWAKQGREARASVPQQAIAGEEVCVGGCGRGGVCKNLFSLHRVSLCGGGLACDVSC